VTFVLGCGFGALLRMLVVLTVIFIRGRRDGRRCLRARCCLRRNAEAEATPPASTDKIDEKSQVASAVESPALTAAAVPKKPEDDVKEIVTVEHGDDQTLLVYWKQ
jgi:hypothetical protein